ncbi:hypothetical protein [Streptomyces natalensis]|uniref:Uncharacterized protein n=1 Tax=Streptomyces natalensis ATCC 27448 TaxID=1240678 RepID=A0A0D7CS34_9ACTN|nr:hypothetical protein [Streptomyces natalensis]KIZ18192.1 hypothetical protein SNA_09250 [Streptomyces natalensis ATCC 27448]
MSRQRAGRRRPSRTGAATRAVPLLALLVPLGGCAPQAPPGDRYPGIQQMLDARARAVRHGDTAALLATVDPSATAFRARQRRLIANLAAVPVTDWRYELLSTDAFALPGGPRGRMAAKVRLSYRLRGYDTAPVTSLQYLTLTERAGRWRISGDTDGAAVGRPGTRQLWDQGPVRVVRGRHSLVLGGAGDPARLRDLANQVDEAVPAVSDAWKGRWSGTVVVEAPDTVGQMAQLLGSGDGDGYTGIAAVTTGEAGASATAPADRVIVNPEAYQELNALGREVVLTHETTHVATRTVTTAATPLWLSEGFADWVAYRDVPDKAATTAPELSHAVADGKTPDSLPTDEDFGFQAGADRLAKAYEGGWLACRMIADKWGEARLLAFYRAAGRTGTESASGRLGPPLEALQAAHHPRPHRSPGSAPAHDRRPERAERLDRAMRDQLGVGLAEFTREWREYVEGQLR